MKRMLAAILAALLCLSIPAALAEDEEQGEIVTNLTTLTVQGTAAITANPDVVCMTVIASATEESPMKAQEQIAGIVRNLREALGTLGLTDDDVVTQDYSFSPEYTYDDGEQHLKGYSARHSLEVTLNDIDKLNDVLAAVTGSGINEVYNISYTVSNRSELYRQALTEAIKAAREKAGTMADACDCDHVSMNDVKEINAYVDVSYANAYRSEAADGKAMETGISAGNVTITATVEATFLAWNGEW